MRKLARTAIAGALLLAFAVVSFAVPPAPSTFGPTLDVATAASRNHLYDAALFGTATNPGVARIIGTTLSAIDPGWPSMALLDLNAANPSTTNTCTLTGAPPNTGTVETYEFLTSGGTVASDVNIGVVVGGTKQITLTSLIAAINGSVSSATGLLKSDGSAARRNGTKYYVADDLTGTVMRLRSAATVGGTVICRADTTTLAETFTSASDLWDVGSGNPINPGHAPILVQQMCQSRTVTASHLLYPSAIMRFTFANQLGAQSISRAMWYVKGSTGITKYPVADLQTVSGSDVIFDLTVGVAPEIIAGDVITVCACGL